MSALRGSLHLLQPDLHLPGSRVVKEVCGLERGERAGFLGVQPSERGPRCSQEITPQERSTFLTLPFFSSFVQPGNRQSLENLKRINQRVPKMVTNEMTQRGNDDLPTDDLLIKMWD